MGRLICLLAALALCGPCEAGPSVVPFPGFSFWIWQGPSPESEDLQVHFRIAREAGHDLTKVKATVKPRFRQPGNDGDFDALDCTLFTEACAAAAESLPFDKVRNQRTRFESTLGPDGWQVHVIRGREQLVFQPDRAERLQRELREASLAVDWYEQLFNPRDAKRDDTAGSPPSGRLASAHLLIGELRDGPCRLEISLYASTYAHLQSFSDSVQFVASRRSRGDQELGPTILSARRALQTGEAKEFMLAEGHFLIRSEPHAGLVSVTLKSSPDLLHPDETIRLNATQLDELAVLLSKFAAARDWLRGHRHLLCRESNLWQPDPPQLKAWIAELWRRLEAGP
ncbi:MAG: hypothetical protein JSR82_24885 [Verrucomicrobia bacterium]|nr:hypothetical protein [Verrucomicrobiota bacterium]